MSTYFRYTHGILFPAADRLTCEGRVQTNMIKRVKTVTGVTVPPQAVHSKMVRTKKFYLVLLFELKINLIGNCRVADMDLSIL